MNQSDPNTSPNRRMHPLVATAVAAVIVASLAATAAITGVFPKASSSNAQYGQTQPVAIAPPPAQEGNAPSASAQPGAPGAPGAAVAPPVATPGASTAPQYAQTPAPQSIPPSTQYAQQPPAEPAPCPSCGTVEAISAVRHEGHGTGIGAVGGAVAGGVIGNQFGGGGGRTAMTLLGAVGGGFGGNAIEKHLRSTTSYSVRVRMENGRTRYFTYHAAPPFERGEHVHVQNGTLVAG